MTRTQWQFLEAAVARMSREEKRRLMDLLQLGAGRESVAPSPTSFIDLENELAAVSFEAPPLPSDFSRADIYTEHD